ncbi:MAG: FHA domain-containing protein, partial [Actinomycetota bacterium]
ADHQALEAALRGGALEGRSPSPPAGTAWEGDGDGTDDGLEDATVARSAAAGAPVVRPEGPARVALVLRFRAGEVVVAPGDAVVLGRDPSGTGAARAELVPGAGADADAATVSKSHLLVAFDGAVATVEDLGSTNGSTLVRDGGAEALAPQAPVTLAPGDAVLLGAVRCEVLLPPEVAA